MMSKKVAFITGGSKGLGFSLSKQLLKEDWIVIVDARNFDGGLDTARQELSHLGEITCVSGSVTDDKHVEEIRQIIESYGGLDLLINNASSLGVTPLPNLLDYPLDDLERVYHINVFAPLSILQKLRASFNKNVKIINVTSDAGVEAYPSWGGYGSSKAALEHVSAVLAVENPDLYIYWVDPGDMQTKMKQDSDPEEDISDLPVPDEVVPAFMRLVNGDLASGRYEAQELIN